MQDASPDTATVREILHQDEQTELACEGVLVHGASSGLHCCGDEPVVREAVNQGEQAEWVCRLACEGISMQGASPSWRRQ